MPKYDRRRTAQQVREVMVRKAKERSALEVKRLKDAGRYAVGGVSGLYLYLNDRNGSSWVLRVTVGDTRKYMGLGSYPEVSLASAREKAREAKDQFKQGINPKERRKQVASELLAQQARSKTFKEAALAYIEIHRQGWKNAKHAAQWESTLNTYAFPIIGNLSVKDVDQEGVMRVLEPIWQLKTETASRLRGRLQSILDWSKVRGYRSGDNPAAWKGHLDKLLPAPGKVAKVEHHRALDFQKMADFMTQLRQQKGISAKALEFTILCAARSGEVRGATWSEVDLNEMVWTVPAERMKAGKEHRVPLSETALNLLKCLPRIVGTEHVFPGRAGKALSDASLNKVLKDMGIDAVPHGFRSSFRDWAGESTEFPREIVEQALAHEIGNATERAYRRGDSLTKRKSLMNAWAEHCNGPKVNELAEAFRKGPEGFSRWKTQ